MIQQFHFKVYTQEKWKHMSTIKLVPVINSVIHNSEKVEIIQMSINCWK